MLSEEFLGRWSRVDGVRSMLSNRPDVMDVISDNANHQIGFRRSRCQLGCRRASLPNDSSQAFRTNLELPAKRELRVDLRAPLPSCRGKFPDQFLAVSERLFELGREPFHFARDLSQRLLLLRGCP